MLPTLWNASLKSGIGSVLRRRSHIGKGFSHMLKVAYYNDHNARILLTLTAGSQHTGNISKLASYPLVAIGKRPNSHSAVHENPLHMQWAWLPLRPTTSLIPRFSASALSWGWRSDTIYSRSCQGTFVACQSELPPFCHACDCRPRLPSVAKPILEDSFWR